MDWDQICTLMAYDGPRGVSYQRGGPKRTAALGELLGFIYDQDRSEWWRYEILTDGAPMGLEEISQFAEDPDLAEWLVNRSSTPRRGN